MLQENTILSKKVKKSRALGLKNNLTSATPFGKSSGLTLDPTEHMQDMITQQHLRTELETLITKRAVDNIKIKNK